MLFSIEVLAQTSITEEPTELVSEPSSNTTRTPFNESLLPLSEEPALSEDSEPAIITERPVNRTTIKIISTCDFRNGTCGFLLDNLFEVRVFEFLNGERKMLNVFSPSEHGRTIFLSGPGAESVTPNEEFNSLSNSEDLAESAAPFKESHKFGPDSLNFGPESLILEIDDAASIVTNSPIQYQIRQVQNPIGWSGLVFNDFTTYSSECVGEITLGENRECRIHTDLSIRP
jgi:hypothetical protein